MICLAGCNVENKKPGYHPLWHLLNCLAGPAKSGPKWVTYSREQSDAMVEVVKQMLEKEQEQSK